MEIGVDIVEIHRIEKACRRNRFLNRFFSERELGLIGDSASFYPRIAGRFAAKEAVAKALGTGFRYFRWRDIEILNDLDGRPRVVLSGKAGELLKSKGFEKVLVTISHGRDYAVAFAVALGGVEVESDKPLRHEGSG
jgi:holo-[acyl-carrier protein] synthase